jgi:monoglucosyldiacylglycerol epimerase
MISTITTATVWALGSLLWVEVVRDSYHAISHYWQPLYRLHVWHHRVFRQDLTAVSEEIYQKAHWYNDVPEALVMLAFSLLLWAIASATSQSHVWTAGLGSLYTLSFLAGAIARGTGVPYADELTDVTHRPGPFTTLPATWFVNRPYHWRHHFDNQKAYYSGTIALVDKVMGTALSLKGKTIAVTGASGTLGRSLLKHLYLQEAKIIALTSTAPEIAIDIGGESLPVKTIVWQVGKEEELAELLESIDILIVNHGINVHSERTQDAIALSYEVNTFSVWRLMELFFATVRSDRDIVRKEIWLNTSETEANPSFSPLYELSKRAIGDLITLRRLDAPCVVRKLILGPFKSDLNPIGIMSGDRVAKQIINLAKRDIRNIIVTVNPLTYVTFPIKEFCTSTYFKLFSRREL